VSLLFLVPLRLNKLQYVHLLFFAQQMLSSPLLCSLQVHWHALNFLFLDLLTCQLLFVLFIASPCLCWFPLERTPRRIALSQLLQRFIGRYQARQFANDSWMGPLSPPDTLGRLLEVEDVLDFDIYILHFVEGLIGCGRRGP